MNPGKSKIPQEWGIEKFFDNFSPNIGDTTMGAWHFPLVADLGTDNPLIVGTAFPINDTALVTAKHVLEEIWEARRPINIDRSLTALQFLSEDRFITLRTTGCLVHKTADLAILFVDSSSNIDNPRLLRTPWKIRPDAPCKDEWVAAFGYVKGNLQIVSRNPSGGGVIEVTNQGQLSFGIVKKVYNKYRDRVMLSCPCFEVSAKCSPGMSGGPVFDKQGALCGIVSSGIEGTASSHVVTLWPSLSQIYTDGLDTLRPSNA